MTYFSKFPLYLTRTLGTEQVIITDFFRRIRVGRDFGDNFSGLTSYAITDGDTPESIANQFYGSPFYHWVILLVNGIVNVREEWPMEWFPFETFMRDNYTNINGLLHYENPDTGYEEDPTDQSIPITNYEYEQSKNENKRQIRILDPDYLSLFVQTFENKIAK